MMAQYRRIKSGLPQDALLLFRLGDFYEMFYEDAKTGAQVLNLALTKRNGVPMCGIPHHSASVYIGKLLKAGFKVAICDQLEEARPGKLVKRDVTQILSPGAHFDERLLAAEQNNFLAAVCVGARKAGPSDTLPGEAGGRAASAHVYGLALVDLTTGDFRATEVEGAAALLSELERLRPAEIIYPSEAEGIRALLCNVRNGSPAPGSAAAPGRTFGASPAAQGWFVTGYEDWAFAPDTAFYALRDHFKVTTLDGFGLKDRQAAICAAGAVVHYLTQQLRRDVRHLTRITFYQRTEFMVLDYTTLRHLEVLEPLHHDAPRNASLFGVLNHTVTPMGARRLRMWLSQPLAAVEPIRRRQEVVQAFVDNPAALDEFRAALGEVRDLERTLGRLSTGNCNARDLVALRLALEQVPNLKRVLQAVGESTGATGLIKDEAARGAGPVLLTELESQLVELPELAGLIARAIVDDPPLGLKEGGIIRDGYSAELDELRAAMRSGKDWIARLQQREIERTGIQSLKIRFNSVFGYYIEVTKANLNKVPPHYIRKQTIAGGERFVTPELKEMENKILGAEERSFKLEYDLFQRVREAVLAHLPQLQQTAGALAQLDVLAAFAHAARLYNYCRPQVADEGIIFIRDGRHPVLEQTLVGERFVPNDAALASAKLPNPEPEKAGSTVQQFYDLTYPQIALITGPNMAGKSTYIRQVALIVLLAHTGSFVPAAEARIDLVDRIFTRIGAADDIARGQSTFMVEMTETANILNNATPRSLVILDEIGRGTSTFDGLALAWSIVEHLHNVVGAKTLFATHYHELTELAARLPRLKNYNVAVREWHDQIVFLRKIVEGGTDKSYGIHVARLAGVPKEVLERAKVILANLEESELNPDGTVRKPTRRQRDRDKLKQLAPPPQLDLFSQG